jgi:hypothetical protein
MTQAPVIQPLLPGTDGFDALLGEIAAGAKDRDLNDQNPFDQVISAWRRRPSPPPNASGR